MIEETHQQRLVDFVNLPLAVEQDSIGYDAAAVDELPVLSSFLYLAAAAFECVVVAAEDAAVVANAFAAVACSLVAA